MFGSNPIRSVEQDTASLAVQDIFYTIQGEGPYAGCPAVFIRLAGCNLACTFCDTEFETGINNRMTLHAILEDVHTKAQAAKYPTTAYNLVVLTGGEPLRQRCGHLIQHLLDAGVRHIQIETAGTLWDDELVPFIASHKLTLVCSPKTPRIHPLIARYCSHYKYIIQRGRTAEDDGLPIGGTQPGNHLMPQRLHRPWDVTQGHVRHPITVWVSPCDETDPVLGRKTTLNTEETVRVAMLHGYRLSIQMHTLEGVDLL